MSVISTPSGNRHGTFAARTTDAGRRQHAASDAARPLDRMEAAVRHRSSRIAQEAADALAVMERETGGQSAAFSLLGHKGDLILVHFRRSFDELNQVERRLARLALWDYMEPTSSYLSVVELGLYDSSLKTYGALTERGIVPFSPEWKTAIDEVMARQREAMAPRLFPDMPPHKYLCFYPMDRKRGELKNWYLLPMAERQRQMHEHGKIGRRYAAK